MKSGAVGSGSALMRLSGTFGIIGGMTSVLIVDDHDGFRSWARRLLEADGFDVVGEAPDGTTALTAVDQLDPDVVLLDVQLPDRDGFWVAEQLTADRHPVQLVLVSTREQSDYADRLNGSGVSGFITKSHLTADRLRDLLSR